MDPILSNDERKMQEDMLQHEFPFDEQAWASMEALLESREDRPLGGPPPPVNTPVPGAGARWRVLLGLLFLFGCVAAALFWQNPAENLMVSPLPKASNWAVSDSNLVSQKLVGTPNSTSFKSKKPGVFEDFAPRMSLEKSKSSQNMVAQQGIAGETALSAPRTSAISTTSNLPAPNAVPAVPETDLQPTLNPVNRWDVGILPAGPLDVVDFQTKHRRPDSLVRPLKVAPNAKNNLTEGWILGFNANTVDYSPLRLSTLPHVGYFKGYQIRARTTFQVEFLAKFVTGYNIDAQFKDIVPGGSSYIEHKTNNMLFLELPLVIKHQYKPDFSWLVGGKPALGIQIAPTGETSIFNDGPSRRNSSQEGTRWLDFGLVIGWQWQFKENWALDVRYNQGLLDLTHDQFYNDRITHLNSDLQVSLRYFLGH